MQWHPVTPLSSIAAISCRPCPGLGDAFDMACKATKRRLTRMAAMGVLASIGVESRGWASSPLLYHQPAYESPIRGEPDDLLLIPGFGFSADDQVVYQAFDGGRDELPHPSQIPAQSTATLGIAEVVSTSNIPYSLTVRLPKTMRQRQGYAMWVVTRNQEWSKPVRINDARPLWLSPVFAYSTTSVASLPRYLKIVGRNLESAPDETTEVRLSGPAEVTLTAGRAVVNEAALDHYVALVNLPSKLIPGAYRVQVKRDRSDWIDLSGQLFEVRPDPARLPEFKVDAPAYGGCKADDGLDDVGCVVRAIAAAEAMGGGTVTFGPGTWNLSELTMTQPNGIVVPRGVNLRGAGKLETTILQNADGRPLPAKATFTLLGRNIVEGMTFRDAHVYGPEYVNSTFLQLGPAHGEGAPV